MTSNLKIPKISKVNNMSGIKSLVGKKMSKSVKFMGEEVKIHKLCVSEVMEIQSIAKNMKEDEEEGLSVLSKVIRSAVEGAEDLTDEDFSTFPLDELSKLSAEIMKFSGIGADQGK